MINYETFRQTFLYPEHQTHPTFSFDEHSVWEGQAYLTAIRNKSESDFAIIFESPAPKSPILFNGIPLQITLKLEAHESISFLNQKPIIGDKYNLKFNLDRRHTPFLNNNNQILLSLPDLSNFERLTSDDIDLQRAGPGASKDNPGDPSGDWRLFGTLHHALLKGRQNTKLEADELLNFLFSNSEDKGPWKDHEQDPKSYPDWKDTLMAWDMGFYSLQRSISFKERPFAYKGTITLVEPDTTFLPRLMTRIIFHGRGQDYRDITINKLLAFADADDLNKHGIRSGQDIELIVQYPISSEPFPNPLHQFHKHHFDGRFTCWRWQEDGKTKTAYLSAAGGAHCRPIPKRPLMDKPEEELSPKTKKIYKTIAFYD